MQSHGTGNFGIRITWKDSRKQTELWSPTEQERDADYRMHDKMPDVKSVTRIKR